MLSLKSLPQFPTSKNWLTLFRPGGAESKKSEIKSVSKSLPIFSLLTAQVLLSQVAVQALQVQINPQPPRLGDTLSVVVQSDNPAANPTIKRGEKTYQTFPIGANQFRGFVPTSPLDKAGTWTIQVSEGDEVKNIPIQVQGRSFPIQRINLPPGKAGTRATQHELTRVAAFKELITPEKFWNGAFIAPNRGRRSTGYGVRRYYNGKFAQDYYHRGVDYAGAQGSPVVAPAGGRVALVGTVSQGFRVHGNVVGLDHGQGVTSIFMHLSRINVKEGDVVKPGQLIGAVGTTGASTGPHLHWGLYVHGVSVDPARWLSSGLQ